MFKKRRFMAIVVACLALLGVIAPTPNNPVAPTSTAEAAVVSNARYWAFCGPQWETTDYVANGSFDDPQAWNKASAMQQSGMDATHGPCMPVPADYTAAFPGSRYAPPAQQFATMWVNSHYGMKTIIYDARLWSSDAATRNAAINFWAPHKAWIEAIDLGDEYPCWNQYDSNGNLLQWWDPNTQFYGTQWQHLGKRYEILWHLVTNNSALAGIPGYTTHFSPQYSITVSGQNCLQRARWEFLNAWSNLGYDDYNVGNSHWWANWTINNVGAGNFVCAISVLENAPGHANVPNPLTQTSIVNAVGGHRYYGCDTMLWFNPGDSKAPAPFAGLKGLANPGGVGRSDWGAAAAISKNYSW